jgi:hypothetical protein
MASSAPYSVNSILVGGRIELLSNGYMDLSNFERVQSNVSMEVHQSNQSLTQLSNEKDFYELG